MKQLNLNLFLLCVFSLVVSLGPSRLQAQSKIHGDLFKTKPDKLLIKPKVVGAKLKTFDGFDDGSGSKMTFGRLFGDELPSFTPDAAKLIDLGNAMVDDGSGSNSATPAIYTYFGQFVDHDVTFDITPLSTNLANIANRKNFRDPSLALDSVYGAGPAANPFLYQRDAEKFLIGRTAGNQPNDLPRLSNKFAVIGDPRNDENLLVAQVHLAFMKAHNRIYDSIATGTGTVQSDFELAHESLAWHYQWILVNDFLKRILDEEVLNRTVLYGPSHFDVENPSMPIEFSVAAYRFGHTMVRANYDFNNNFPNSSLGQLFSFTGGGGSAPIPDSWIIDWDRFVNDPPATMNFARKFDPYLARPLGNLPGLTPSSLAVRNLLRGRALGLPSGQAVATYLGAELLTEAELTTGPEKDAVEAGGFQTETPLWYYILKEAEVKGAGEKLGKVGSTIIAEVFVGLLLADESSYLSKNPGWQPTLTLTDGTTKVDTLPKLIRFSQGE